MNQKIHSPLCRISLEDGGDNESMSISNQKLMLRDFCRKNGMFQYEYYVDDGYTGRNFNRPSFQRMIADIEAGKIGGCVITKTCPDWAGIISKLAAISKSFPKNTVYAISPLQTEDSLTRQKWTLCRLRTSLNDSVQPGYFKGAEGGMTRSRQGIL